MTRNHAEGPLIVATHVNTGEVTLEAYDGPGGDVVIPNTIEGLPAVGMGTGMFQSKYDITRVTVAGSVTNVGTSALRAG